MSRSILYPVPPPTSNNLDAHQRARLVRSTRKLGALLGTTPQLLELDLDAEFPPMPTFTSTTNKKAKAAMTMNTSASCRSDTPESLYHIKKARRHASLFQLFPNVTPPHYLHSEGGNTSNSSSSSLDLLSSPYSSSTSASVNSSVASFTLDSEPRSSSDSTSTSSTSHSLPTPISFSSKPRKVADSARPRPLVLRLNAVPVAPSDPRLPYTPTTNTNSTHQHPYARATAVIASTSPRTPTSATTPKARSKFSDNLLDDISGYEAGDDDQQPDVPISPLTPVPPLNQLELRRKKMAKLTRTLGEQVPPELVFATRAPDGLPPLYDLPVAKLSAEYGRQDRDQYRRQRHPHHSSSEQERHASQTWVTGTHSWRGEWNRKDIQDVRRGLRNLKAR